MPPLTGYNSNVRHRGRMFHIQTEDSGESLARIMTHLFADGGRIVKSLRTEYAEHLAEGDWQSVVRDLMKDQHKALFVALRSGELDDVIGFEDDAPPPTQGKPSLRLSAPLAKAPRVANSNASLEAPPSTSVTPKAPDPPSSGARTYAAPRPCAIFSNPPRAASLFGEQLDEHTLDSAILEYLADASGK